MTSQWVQIKPGAAKLVKEPVIYFNPSHKRIFFYQPHGFKHGDYIFAEISNDKKQVIFGRLPILGFVNNCFKFIEFDDKKGTIDCGVIFNEFPELFAVPNKYQSKVTNLSETISDYKLLINLEIPLKINRRVKKELLEIEQMAFDLADKKGET